MMPKATLLLLTLTLMASVACAQQPAPLTGTITLRSGETLSGVIKTADLGVMDGAGLGSALNGYGNIQMTVNGVKQTIPATNIASLEATWADKSTPEETSWEISELRLTTRDGQVLVGKPAWHFHITSATVELPSGETKRVNAYPLGGSDFSANNLLSKIELAPPGATPTPVAPTPVAPTPTAPTPVTPVPVAPTPDVPTPVAPTPTAPEPVAPTPVAPAPVAPTPEAPTPSAPAPTVAAPITVTANPPAGPSGNPDPTPGATAAVASAVAGQLTNVNPGQPMVIKVPVAGTNKVVNILLYVNITEEGLEVMPPAQ